MTIPGLRLFSSSRMKLKVIQGGRNRLAHPSIEEVESFSGVLLRGMDLGGGVRGNPGSFGAQACSSLGRSASGPPRVEMDTPRRHVPHTLYIHPSLARRVRPRLPHWPLRCSPPHKY